MAMDESAVQRALSRAAASYKAFVAEAANRAPVPVQKGDADSIDLHRVTIGSHDSLSLPEDSDMSLRLATIRSSNDFHLKPLQRALWKAEQIYNEYLK